MVRELKRVLPGLQISRSRGSGLWIFIFGLGSKPRTTDLRPWLWGAALAGSSEHSPRTIMVWVGVEIVRGSSPRSRTGRSVVRGKPDYGLALTD